MATKYAKYAGTSRARALSWVGKKYPAGWCLKFVLTEILGSGGVGDYDGDHAADAEDYAKAAAKAGTLQHASSLSDIPAGALVLWVGGSKDHGHAAYSLGDGLIVSTDLPKMGTVGRVTIGTVWPGLTLAGYVTVAPNGDHFIRPKAKPKPDKGTRYRVAARSGLMGRVAASTLAKTRVIRPYGDELTGKPATTAGWTEGTDGLFYASRYLTAL